MGKSNLAWLSPFLALAAGLLGLAIGPGGFGLSAGPEVMAIRLPRVLLGMLAGIGLASSGAALQAVLGNPLAEPYLLGVAGGAACGSALAIVLGLGRSFLGSLASPIFAMACALAVILFVYRLARVHGRLPAETVILSGLVANAFCSGLIMLLMALAGRQLPEVLSLMMGSLGVLVTSGNIYLFIVCSLAILFGSALLWIRGRELNLFSLGEAQAHSLGVAVEPFKRRTFLTVAVVVAAIVSLCGVIGFVGLIVPHLARMLVGPDNRRAVPVSAMLGASLLVLADIPARTLVPQELPIGVVMALLGVPFFVFLLWRKKRSGS